MRFLGADAAKLLGLTSNIMYMLVTFSTFHSRGWLKSEASCHRCGAMLRRALQVGRMGQAAAGLTRNIRSMLVTLATSHSRVWLKSEASCQVWRDAEARAAGWQDGAAARAYIER